MPGDEGLVASGVFGLELFGGSDDPQLGLDYVVALSLWVRQRSL